MQKRIFLILALLPCVLKAQFRIDTLTYSNLGDNYGYTLIYSNNEGITKEELYYRDNQLSEVKEFTKDSIKERKIYASEYWELIYPKERDVEEGKVFVYNKKGNQILSGKFVRNVSSSWEFESVSDDTITSETFYLCSYYKNLRAKKCYCQEGYTYMPIGKYTEYYRNGKKSIEGNYDFFDIRTGIWQQFYVNGNLKSEGEYESYNILSNPNGDASVVLKTVYLKNGLWKYYSKNNKIIKEKIYHAKKSKNGE